MISNKQATGVLLFALILAIFSSCSSISKTSKQKGTGQQGASVYPGWYSNGDSFVPDSLNFYGYATALAGDSATVSKKAIIHAKSELMSGISGKLESIRKLALKELNDDSGLDTPGFIVTLRNAEKQVQEVSRVTNLMVEQNGSSNAYRGFAEVTADSAELVAALDQAMSRYRTAWGILKDTRAFAEF